MSNPFFRKVIYLFVGAVQRFGKLITQEYIPFFFLRVIREKHLFAFNICCFVLRQLAEKERSAELCLCVRPLVVKVYFVLIQPFCKILVLRKLFRNAENRGNLLTLHNRFNQRFVNYPGDLFNYCMYFFVGKSVNLFPYGLRIAVKTQHNRLAVHFKKSVNIFVQLVRIRVDFRNLLGKIFRVGILQKVYRIVF